MADVLSKLRPLRKKDKKMDEAVSFNDITPGSLSIWMDLPEEIKGDPLLAPLKRKFEDSKASSNVSEEGGSSLKYEDQGADREQLERFIEAVNEVEDQHVTPKRFQIRRGLKVLKISILVGCWLFLTIALLLKDEGSDSELRMAIQNGTVKEYTLPNNTNKIFLTVNGPFNISSDEENGDFAVWLHRAFQKDCGVIQQTSPKCILKSHSPENLDLSPSVSISRTLFFEEEREVEVNFNCGVQNYDNRTLLDDIGNDSNTTLRLKYTGLAAIPVTLTYKLNPIDEKDGVLYSAILLLILYVLIIFELVNRTIAAILCSSLSVAVQALIGEKPSLSELVSWLDVETLLLLFSMMVLIAVVAETGLFDRIAVFAFEVTRGKTWPLINCLCFFTAFFSTFLDNVTTVLLMTPVTIRLCEVMQLNPVPVLMSMVIFSNVGGAATPVGDPPNVIIASHPAVLHQNLNFATFTLHMGLGILLVAVQTYLQLRYMLRNIEKTRRQSTHLQDIEQKRAAWRKAAASLASFPDDKDAIEKVIHSKVNNLTAMLNEKEIELNSPEIDSQFASTLKQMKKKCCIRDKPLLIKSCVCVGFVVLVFFLHAVPELQRLSLGWTALLGAVLLLILADKEDMESILARVEWSTLLFFAALFVMMEALSKLGLISWIGKMTESVIVQVDDQHRLTVAILLVLWVSGVASAFIDNIPLTTMMVRVTTSLADPEGLGLPLAPLVWALSFGACLGGNGTLIGASANVVCAGVAEQHGYKFTFTGFLRIGFPIMLGNLLTASAYLLICHCVFHWH